MEKEKTKKLQTKKVQDNIFVACMLLIPVVHFLIFWVGVNFNSLLLAFQKLNPLSGEKYFTWANFSVLKISWQIGDLKIALGNTLLTFALYLLLLPWGFFITYFLFKRIIGHNIWRTMLFLPTIVPAMAMTAIFSYLVAAKGPVGNFIWHFFKMEVPPAFIQSDKYARWTMLFYIAWTNFGGQFILYMGAMSRIPVSVLEAAKLDGAGMWVEMIKIVLPLCWPTISMLLLMNISSMFVVSGPLLLFWGLPPSATTISYKIFNETRIGGHLLSESAALGVVCTLILFPIVLLSRWLLEKVYADVEF